MVKLMVNFLIMAMETRGGIYFFDTFLEKKEQNGFLRHKFFIYLVMFYLTAFSELWIGMYKCVLVVLVCALMNLLYYHVSFRHSLIFSVINCAVVFLLDYVTLCICKIILPGTGTMTIRSGYLPALSAKLLWLVVLLVIRQCSRRKTDYHLLTGREWLQLAGIPVFTIICVLFMYISETDEGNVQGIFLFLSAGFVAVNFIVMNLMQEILEKEEKIRIGVLTEQNQKNRLDAYQDREEIYERQRKKMHDYKNQLATIQILLKSGKADEALSFTEKLTESIAVDMSAINTNHPVVNAVLNQKYRSMQEKNIGIILKVGDLHDICLNEEEIVILLSNLLDNAIRESEKVLKKTGKAVIHLKLACEEQTMILAIRNPVTEKVEIVNDTVKSRRGENHGIGLRNVKAVVDKYEGDMVLSCDDNEFKVIVICNNSRMVQKIVI